MSTDEQTFDIDQRRRSLAIARARQALTASSGLGGSAAPEPWALTYVADYIISGSVNHLDADDLTEMEERNA